VRSLDRVVKKINDLEVKIADLTGQIIKITQEINSLLTDDQKIYRDNRVFGEALQREYDQQQKMVEYLLEYQKKLVASTLKYNAFITFYEKNLSDPTVGPFLKKHLARPIARYTKLVTRLDGYVNLTDKTMKEKYGMAAAPSKMLKAMNKSIQHEKDSQEEIILSMGDSVTMFEDEPESENFLPKGKN